MSEMKNPAAVSFEEIKKKIIIEALADPAKKAELIKAPKAAFAKHGVKFPQDLEIEICVDTPKKRYIVLPSQEMSGVAGGGCCPWLTWKGE